MGGLRMTRNDLAAYEMLSRAGSDIKGGMMQYGLSRAADVKPETVSDTALTETTAGTDGMVYDSDTGQYLPQYSLDGTTLSEQAVGQQQGDPAPEGMRPTFDAKTTTRHKMGDREQDAPFSQEQIDAQVLRNQSQVHSRFGNSEKAFQLTGLAKQREDEGINTQIRTAATRGMKNTKDMRDEEKIYAMSKSMYEESIRLNRPDLAAGYYTQMTQNRDALLSRANDRADRVYRSTGNISGFVDAYNRYVADGLTIDQFKRNADGSHVFTVNDGSGKTRDIAVPKERVAEYLMALRDPKRIGELEAKRAEILFKSQADAQEQLNKPVAVGKDQTLMIPGTGQTFAPGANRGFDVKEAGPILDDSRKILSQIKGNAKFGSIPGQVEWTPAGASKIVTAERLFMKNPSLTPAQLAEIADKGTTGTAVIDVGGKQQRVPAVSYGGRTFVLGGADAGQATPEQPAAAPASKPGGQPVAPRQVSGKIGGMQKVSARNTPTPADFPRVSANEQAGRDAERRAILQRELDTYPKDGSPARKALEDEARRAGIAVPA